MFDRSCLSILILVKSSLLCGHLCMWHSVIMSLCHHVICTLCANCVLSSYVNVSFCQCHYVNMLYGHCMPCHYVQCHMLCPMLYGHCHAMANWLWVVFMCELILVWCCGQVIFVFMQPIRGRLHIADQCVVWVVLFSVWKCQLLCVRLWKSMQSRCPLWS